MTTDNKQVVEQFWDALARRDWDGMKALLTDDAHYTDVGTPGPGGTGPDGVVDAAEDRARAALGLRAPPGHQHDRARATWS